MTAKYIHDNTILGEQGVNLVQRVVLGMGCAWNPTTVDAGIDGSIELRHPTTGEALNLVVLAQVKATARPFPSETAEGFSWPVDERDLQYWLSGNAPVLLVVTRPKSDEAYWVSVKHYFADPASRKRRTVRFDKEKDAFTAQSFESLMRLARPRDVGIYLGPPPVSETLISNLLAVDSYAPYVSIAECSLPSAGAVWAALKDAAKEPPTGEWFLKEGKIYSFLDLERSAWRGIVAPGTLEQIESSHFADSKDHNLRRDFVWLLGRCLTEKLRAHDVRWDKEHRYHYFTARPGPHPDRKLKYLSRQQRTARDVVRSYRKSKDGTTRYCRHSALRTQFVRRDSKWYLELTPDYHFTRDGWRHDRFYEERLKGIKRLERNSAVLGQVLMWAWLLRDEAGLWAPMYGHLTFGGLFEAQLGVGVDEDRWLGAEELAAATGRDPDLFDR